MVLAGLTCEWSHVVGGRHARPIGVREANRGTRGQSGYANDADQGLARHEAAARPR
jgi:hypothetical protein